MHISNDSIPFLMKVRDRNASTNIKIYKEKSKKSNKYNNIVSVEGSRLKQNSCRYLNWK